LRIGNHGGDDTFSSILFGDWMKLSKMNNVLIFLVRLLLLGSCLPLAAADTVYLFPASGDDIQEAVQNVHLCRVGVNRSFFLVKQALLDRGMFLKVNHLENYPSKSTFLEKILKSWGYVSKVDEDDVSRYVIWSWMITGNHYKRILKRLPYEKTAFHMGASEHFSPTLSTFFSPLFLQDLYMG
jgi:hypothetical protein